MRSAFLGLVALALAGSASAQQVGEKGAGTLNSQLSGDLVVHDPVIIREGDTYYVFSTVGKYIGIKTSTDLKAWKDAGSVFSEIPAWAKDAVPGTGYFVCERRIPALLFGLDFRVEPLGDRPRYSQDPRREGEMAGSWPRRHVHEGR
jgi:hypothetical protein